MKYLIHCAVVCAFVGFGILTKGFTYFGAGLSEQFVTFLQAIIALFFVVWIVVLCAPISKKIAEHSNVVPFKELDE